MLQKKPTEYTRTMHEEEDISLRYIFNQFSKWLSTLSRRIGNLVDIVSRRKSMVISVVAVGLALGYLAYFITRPYYKSSMTLVLAEIRNDFVEDQLEKLALMIEEDNYEAVAERLDISTQSASQIKEMKFFNLDQNKVEEDSILTGSPFRIELSLYNRESFGAMEPAITSYIENNRYFARQKRIKQREVENMVSKLRGEISSIDSMKTSVSEPRGPVNGFVYGQPIDPTNLYKESISMYKEQVKLEADLERLDNVEIVTGFTPRLRPTGPKLLYYLATGAILAFIVATIIAVNLESKKRRRAGIA